MTDCASQWQLMETAVCSACAKCGQQIADIKIDIIFVASRVDAAKRCSFGCHWTTAEMALSALVLAPRSPDWQTDSVQTVDNLTAVTFTPQAPLKPFPKVACGIVSRTARITTGRPVNQRERERERERGRERERESCTLILGQRQC